MRKRFFNVVVSVMLLCTLFLCGNAFAETVQPLYNNTASVSTAFVIDDNGVARTSVSYQGYKGVTTSARIEIQIKKKGFLGLSWSVVNIGEPNNVKVYELNGYMGSELYEFQLNSKGTYKAIIKYYVYGSGGEVDVIESEVEKKY